MAWLNPAPPLPDPLSLRVEVFFYCYAAFLHGYQGFVCRVRRRARCGARGAGGARGGRARAGTAGAAAAARGAPARAGPRASRRGAPPPPAGPAGAPRAPGWTRSATRFRLRAKPATASARARFACSSFPRGSAINVKLCTHALSSDVSASVAGSPGSAGSQPLKWTLTPVCPPAQEAETREQSRRAAAPAGAAAEHGESAAAHAARLRERRRMRQGGAGPEGAASGDALLGRARAAGPQERPLPRAQAAAR